MYKELIICVFIIIIIICLECITQSYTKNSSHEVEERLEFLKEQIKNQGDKEENIQKMEELYSKWEEFHDISAIYIEHNELEKVEMSIIGCKNYIEQEIYDMASNEIDKAIFGLEHIQDKYKFNLINVF